MPIDRRLLLISSLTAAWAEVGAQTPAMRWVCTDVPPFLWRGPDGGPRGYAYELSERVMQRAGLRFELQFCPWARVMLMLQSGRAQAGLVVARTPTRETQFGWLFPVGYFRFALFTRRDGPAVPRDLASLQGWRIAVLRGSSSRELLAGAGLSVAAEGKDYVDLIALLQRGVVSAIVGPEAVVRAQLGRQQLPQDDYQATALERRLELYAAAHASVPEALQQRISLAYKQLVEDGSVAQLKRLHADAFAER